MNVRVMSKRYVENWVTTKEKDFCFLPEILPDEKQKNQFVIWVSVKQKRRLENYNHIYYLT